MKLSILVPSKRQDSLNLFESSLRKHSVTNDVELVILVDDEESFVTRWPNRVVIHYPPKRPVNMSLLNYECYNEATGDWIMLCNDDIICETPEWDRMLFGAIEQYGKDGMALFWPEDNMFGIKLSCFPIVSRKLLELIKFFPQPYRRYKQDDTIFNVVPNERKYFLSNIKFTHHNDEATEGFNLGNGKIYPIDREAGDYDEKLWSSEAPRRYQMRNAIAKELGLNTTRVVVAISTQEMARRADFYDCMDVINNPPGIEVLKTKVHAQSPAKARNIVIEKALNEGCTHILFVDDDVYPEPDTIAKLLRHDKDIVTGLYLSRNYPHRPYIFDVWENGGAKWRHLYPGDAGLIPIVAAGFGVCLIKTKVFQAMERPWVRLGELELDNWCDDIGFFKRAGEAGFESFCDLECVAGHVASVIVHPKLMGNQWYTSYWTASGEGEPVVPQVFPELETAKV